MPTARGFRRAKFAKGAALARKGDYRAAELIYREQAEFLLSTERKQELASIYLDFADAYFQPEDEIQEARLRAGPEVLRKGPRSRSGAAPPGGGRTPRRAVLREG